MNFYLYHLDLQVIRLKLKILIRDHLVQDGMYGLDTAETIVIYFLSNATTWRGAVAREVKVELKKRYAGLAPMDGVQS